MNRIIIITAYYFTLCCYKNAVSDTTLYDQNTVTPIELAAVGRVADLGELYDARSDQFLTLNLFKSDLPNASISLTQNRETKLRYTQQNSYEEKFQALDISAELKLSILFGLIEVDGSGRYFKNTKTSDRTEQASLITSFSTSFQKISVTESSIQSAIDFDVLEIIDATHVVVGIQWGGNVMITVEDSSYEKKESENTLGSLGLKMKNLAGLIGASGSGQVNISQSEINEMNRFSFEIIGDILPDSTPQSFIDAIRFMQTAPINLQKSNNGKGKAMKYKLLSINVLRKLWKLNSAVNSVLKSVDEATVKRCVKLFDDMNKVEQKINDLAADVEKWEHYFAKSRINEVMNLQNNYDIYHSEVQQNLSEHLVKVRSGNETVNQLHNEIQSALKHPYSHEIIDLSPYNLITEEISFIQLLKKRNVTVLNKKIIFNNFLLENFNNQIYILFYNFTRNKDVSASDFWYMLENKQKFGATAVFAAISIQILNENNYQSQEKEKISLFLRGETEIENFQINHIPVNATNPELWSFNYMQNQLSTLINNFNLLNPMRNQVSTLISDITSLKENPIPIGFIYIQLPDQPNPSSLWPNVNWRDVTSNYAGLFFRAEGGGSGAFGEVQNENSPHLTNVWGDWTYSQVAYKTVVLNENGYWSDPIWSGYLPKGGTASGDTYLKFKVSSGEVRPRNKAVRIWRRTS